MKTIYLLTGWSSNFIDPGFEYEFATLEEAKMEAMKILSKKAQTSLCIYKAEKIGKGRRSNGDPDFMFESLDE